MEPDRFSVYRHRPSSFLLVFRAREDKDVVLNNQVLWTPFLRLGLVQWMRRAHAAAGALCVHIDVEIESIPDNCWDLAVAETVLAPHAWVDRLHPLTRSRAPSGSQRGV